MEVNKNIMATWENSSKNELLKKQRRRDEELLRKVCISYQEAGNQDGLSDFLRALEKVLAKQL